MVAETDKIASVVKYVLNLTEDATRYASIAICSCPTIDPLTSAGIVVPVLHGIMEGAALCVAGADVGPTRMRIGTITAR